VPSCTVDTSTKARHTVLGKGTKVWFQMPLAAANCQTPKNTSSDSTGRAARVSGPRQVPGPPPRAVAAPVGVTSTNTDMT